MSQATERVLQILLYFLEAFQCLALSSAANEKSKTRLVLNSQDSQNHQSSSPGNATLGTEFEKSVSPGSSLRRNEHDEVCTDKIVLKKVVK